MKKWIVSELDKQKVRELSHRLELPAFTAALLVIRGITEEQAIMRFFSPDCELSDPYLMKDMDKAVERIRKAVDNCEKICVYGDYDCDGVTATALLYSYLENCFADVIYYIPDRTSEGYGMNMQAVDKLKKLGVQLIVTVDNGISAIDEIMYADSLGIDVVVTDHHKPQDILPRAVAVVDPHRYDDMSPFKDLCGAGIALKLAAALEGDSFSVIENYSELAAFGTIADLVPLTEENRSIVKAGLFRMENTECSGLLSLIEKAQINEISAGNVAFRLAPRVNAAGRLGTAYDALTLFLTEDTDEAQSLAEKLSELNARRQSIETEIFEQICSMLDNDPERTCNRIIIVSAEGWNPGVIGIVSSRITERYGKPSIIISENDDICKASGRSVQGFSLVDAVFACSDLLEKYGGHPMAVGLSLKRENISAFCKAMNAYADKLDEMPLPSLKLDCNLKPEGIVTGMVHQLSSFEPFGYGNPKPVFGIKNMTLDKIVPLSNGRHIKLMVSKGKLRFSFVKFSTSPEEFPYPEGSQLDFAVSLDINIYQQKEYLSISIKDIHPSGFDCEAAMREMQLYDDYRRGILSPRLSGNCPDRNDFAAVYMYAKKHPQPVYSIDMLLSAVNVKGLGAFKLLMILDILSELMLIGYSRRCEQLYISVENVSRKVDLENSIKYKKLKEDADHV